MLELVNDFNENVILDLIQKMEEEIQIVQVILTEEEKNLPL